MMTFFFRRCWPWWALLLCWLPSLAAQNVQKIEIRHVGPPAASDEFIRANIKVKAGDLYNPRSVDDDIKTLYATGLFYNISQGVERLPDGLALIYVLQGNLTLADIRFEGNKKYKNSKLLKKVSSKVGERLDERKLFSDAQEIQKLYQKAGYQKTKVQYKPPVVDERTGRGSVVFEITESPKVRIDQVEFVGAKAFPQKKLRKVIKTRRHWMFSWLTGSGVLKDEQFEDDKDKLTAFYQNEGYIDFEIKDIQFENTDPKHMVIRFVIAEGTQYKVGAVEFKGNTLFTAEEIRKADKKKYLKGAKLGVGQVFSPKALDADLEAISDFYGSKGYIDTRVRALKNPNVEKGTMDLVYEIIGEDKGVSRIEKIEIKGNIKTKDKVVRRELAVSPGEVFDMVRVRITKGKLEQMQYFEKVETEVEPTEIANRKNLIVNLEEASTGNIELGAGFSSVDNLVGFVGFREGNFDLFNPPYFRGGGQKFRINVQLGTQRKDYQITFIEPWFLNRQLQFETDLYHHDLRYYSSLYNIKQTGARLSLTKLLANQVFGVNADLIGTASYTLENVGIDIVSDLAPQIIKDEPRDRLASKVGASLAIDTRNNVQLTSRGQRSEIETEFAGGPLGGETDFYKFELRSSWYFPGFFEGHIWELRGRGGVVDNYRNSKPVPLFDRFFLGGVGSLRGYKYREVGPRDGGEPIGGDTYWFGSVEYSVPIIERLRLAIFYDIGNVYQKAYSFTLADGQRFYNDNWGMGIRLNIPRLGPLRLDYGIPVSHDFGTSGSGRFQFSVSYNADY
jgi:outer membrane protein insertion porin family